MFKYVLLFALVAFAAAVHEDAHVVEEKSDVRADGFDSLVVLSDGSSQKSSGDEHGNVHGSFEWVSPEGEHIAIQYVADEHGYQPTGAVLPTSPPIPEAIARSVEYLLTHAPKSEHGH